MSPSKPKRKPTRPNERRITKVLRWIQDTERALRNIEIPLLKAIGLGLLTYHLVHAFVG